MPRFIVAVLLAALFALTPVTRVAAGIADTPLPVIKSGATTLFLYSVSGVGNWGGYMGSYFACTSTDSAPVQVGVEVFANGGGGPANDAVASSLSVQPGQTVRFGTQSATGLTIDSNVGAGLVTGGSARILATSKKIICTAFLADTTNGPPTSMVQLTIIAKLKQKAAN